MLQRREEMIASLQIFIRISQLPRGIFDTFGQINIKLLHLEIKLGLGYGCADLWRENFKKIDVIVTERITRQFTAGHKKGQEILLHNNRNDNTKIQPLHLLLYLLI